jgi:dipeptidyl aminopeptidase/acylaminoacyl peptidase
MPGGAMKTDLAKKNQINRDHKRRRVGVRAVTAAGACLILLACGLVGILSWTASGHVLHPARVSYAALLRQYRRLVSHVVTIHSTTGAIISGRFFPGRTHATIILSHGYGATQEQLLPWASFLHQAGFNVLTYDMRGVGRSSGSITLGALERRDLISVVDYLVSRPDVDKEKIGALGFSLGGATTIMAAAQDIRIKAVVDDSGYADIRHWFKASIVEALRHATDPFSVLSLQMIQWRTGIDADTLRPAARIALISPRPVLIIQGTADETLPPSNSIENYRAARQPKDLWLVPGAGHGQTLQKEGAVYVRRVVAFFRRALHP